MLHHVLLEVSDLERSGSFYDALRPRSCTNDDCGCHIGYVHLEYLELDKVFGAGILERVPFSFAARP